MLGFGVGSTKLSHPHPTENIVLMSVPCLVCFKVKDSKSTIINTFLMPFFYQNFLFLFWSQGRKLTYFKTTTYEEDHAVPITETSKQLRDEF